MLTSDGQCLARPQNFKLIPTGVISFSSTNTSTATTAQASARAIKPVGPAWSRNYFSKAANKATKRQKAQNHLPVCAFCASLWPCCKDLLRGTTHDCLTNSITRTQST